MKDSVFWPMMWPLLRFVQRQITVIIIYITLNWPRIIAVQTHQIVSVFSFLTIVRQGVTVLKVGSQPTSEAQGPIRNTQNVFLFIVVFAKSSQLDHVRRAVVAGVG